MCNWRGGATVIFVIIITNTESTYDGCAHNLWSNKKRVFYCKSNLMIKHNTQILATGIQRENSKDSPSEGWLHKEQRA